MERLGRGPTSQRLRMAHPLVRPVTARTVNPRTARVASVRAILRRRAMSEPIPAHDQGGELAEILISNLDSAFNLARWLVRNGNDAEDVVQEACLRAFQYSDRFRGGDARAWLFTIVRNTAYT